MKKLFVIILLFVAGCATFPVDKMKTGSSIADIKKTVPYANFKATEWPAPDNSNDKWIILVDNFAPPNCGNCGLKPHWILFINDKLVTYGAGDEKDAEVSVYGTLINYLITNKQIKHAEGDRLLYDKVKSVFGSNAFIDEFFTYRIMISDKLDKGEISEEEATYLVTQKRAEIEMKIQQLQNQQAGLQSQQTMQSLMLMGLGLQMMQTSQPYIIPSSTFPNNIRCTTRYIGNQAFTNCY